MKTRQRHTPENIQIYPLDMENLNREIDKFFHESGKHPANITYHAHGNLALMRQPKLCIIDDEFVGHDLSNKIIFYVYEEERFPDGHKVFDAMPTHEVSLPLAELELYLKTPITLAEFTKERRGYNSRIRANESDWIRYLNKM